MAPLIPCVVVIYLDVFSGLQLPRVNTYSSFIMAWKQRVSTDVSSMADGSLHICITATWNTYGHNEVSFEFTLGDHSTVSAITQEHILGHLSIKFIEYQYQDANDPLNTHDRTIRRELRFGDAPADVSQRQESFDGHV